MFDVFQVLSRVLWVEDLMDDVPSAWKRKNTEEVEEVEEEENNLGAIGFHRKKIAKSIIIMFNN